MNSGKCFRVSTNFWSPEYLDCNDPDNEKIWIQSPALQASIQSTGLLNAEGDIGPQQIMIDGFDAPVPWVPDVLGLEWKHPESLIIVGSAYAPFIAGISKRDCTLPLREYVNARSAADFLVTFLRHVITPDRAYYSKIRLLAADVSNQKRIALFDLCRASYAVRGARCSRETMDEAAEYTFRDRIAVNRGKPARHTPARAEASRRLFTSYVEAPQQRQWTLDRLIKSEARRIIALGSIAEYGLLKLFFDANIRTIYQRSRPNQPWFPSRTHGDKWTLKYARARRTLQGWLDASDWWVVEGVVDGVRRRWCVLPVLHPVQNHADSAYVRTRALLRGM
jgi:hypothetical protein